MTIIAGARIVDARPPVTVSESLSPDWPSSTMKAAGPVFSLMAPSKAPNSLLGSSHMSPEVESSSSEGGFVAVNEMQMRSGGHVH